MGWAVIALLLPPFFETLRGCRTGRLQTDRAGCSHRRRIDRSPAGASARTRADQIARSEAFHQYTPRDANISTSSSPPISTQPPTLRRRRVVLSSKQPERLISLSLAGRPASTRTLRPSSSLDRCGSGATEILRDHAQSQSQPSGRAINRYRDAVDHTNAHGHGGPKASKSSEVTRPGCRARDTTHTSPPLNARRPRRPESAASPPMGPIRQTSGRDVIRA